MLLPVTPDPCPIDADVLHDEPGVVTLARLYYETHAEYELVVYPAAELDDFAAARMLVPEGLSLGPAEWIDSEGERAWVMRYTDSHVINHGALALAGAAS